MIKNNEMIKIKNSTATFASSILTNLIFHPIDVLRIRFQSFYFNKNKVSLVK